MRKKRPGVRPRLLAVLVAGLCLASSAVAARAAEKSGGPMTVAELWAAYAKSPGTHPNIPDCSYAGYHYSEAPLPEPKAILSVRQFGAKGDGVADDTPAFKAAIERAKQAGGGAILVPAATYRLTDVITLDASGLVLRGEGPGKTILAFEKSLEDLRGRRGSRWSWNGGLIWVEPAKGGGSGGGSVRIAKPAAMGDTVVEVSAADAARLRGGAARLIRMTWTGDLSLCLHMAGHESMETYDWNSWRALRGGKLSWQWTNEIVAVHGTRVTLKKPLRLDVRPAWKVTLGPLEPCIREVGVERMTLRMPVHRRPGHLKDPGFNGVYLKDAVHAWVRDVAIEQADNGIILDRSSNCTVTGYLLTGGTNHHATMCRNRSHDNLIENFRIESRPEHGLNTEGISSGNVWRRGEMRHGAFDSHCMMSFDAIRTHITIHCDGGPGGARDHGPFLGRRMVHWNIRLDGGANEWVFGPAYMPSGAIVGGQGGRVFTRDTGLWHMPDGPKGCLVVGHGAAPNPPDLFEAQLKWRLGRSRRGPRGAAAPIK